MRPLLFLIALLAGPAHAAEVETILVTGRSLPRSLGADAYATTLIDAARIDATASGRIEDALRDVASFQPFRRTDSRAANPTSQGAALRGLGGNAASRALVTLDGVPLADPFGGWLPWSALASSDIEAIRVTRGGGAGAFGAGALVGSIELLGKGAHDVPRAHGDIVYGSRDAIDVDGGVAAILGDGFASLSAGWSRGDGYGLIPNAQRGPVDVPARYAQWHVTARGIVAVGDARELQARANVFSDERLRGLAGSASRTDGADVSLRIVDRGDWAWEALAYLQMRAFSSGFVAVNQARDQLTPTLDQYNTPATGWGGKLELRPPMGDDHQLRLGVDMKGADGRTRERFRFQSGAFTRLRDAGGRQSVLGLFAEHGWQVDRRLSLTGGVRLDRWVLADGFLHERDIANGAPTVTRDFAHRSGWRPGARGGLTYSLSPMLSGRAAAYTGWRLPTLNELYRPFRVGADVTAANAGLRPERLRGIEIGADVSPMSTARAGVTLFWNRLDDAIANVTLGVGPGLFPDVGFVADGGAYRQRRNVDALVARGLELDARLVVGRVDVGAAYAYTRARVRASGAASALGGLRPAQVPAHRASATVALTPVGDGRIAATLRYESRAYEDDLNRRRLRDALTVDVVARAPVARGLSAEMRAENLFDARIEAGVSSGGIVDLGSPRTLWAGLRWTLE